MQRPTHSRQSKDVHPADVDFAALYDNHSEYVRRRDDNSFERARIDIEVNEYKLPNLLSLLSDDIPRRRVLEIGCATGDLIARFPVASGGSLIGVDLSMKNTEAAAARYPMIEFHAGDFRGMDIAKCDIVVLSDILEHVTDDAEFLKEASRLADAILINLPLEDCLQNRFRRYGVNDPSGHLRKYNISQAVRLCGDAGLDIIKFHQKWSFETGLEDAIRRERRRATGHAYTGSASARALKCIVSNAAAAFPGVGRRLFASSFFALARRKT